MSDLRISYAAMSTCSTELAAAGVALDPPVGDPSSLGSAVVAGALDDALSALDLLRAALSTETTTLGKSAADAVATLQQQDGILAKAPVR